MGLNNAIENRIASNVWLALGSLGLALWLDPEYRAIRREIGVWRSFFAKTGSPEDRRILRYQGRIFAFFAAWLSLYFLLDWIF